MWPKDSFVRYRTNYGYDRFVDWADSWIITRADNTCHCPKNNENC